MSSVVLAKSRDARVRFGHPWIYESDISKVDGEYTNGDIVDVYNFNMKFLGRGYINDNSKISVRLLSRVKEDIDSDFFARKISHAVSYRDIVAKMATSRRLIFGEGDGLPGLIVDQYSDTLVVQVLTLGMELRKDLIVKELRNVTGCSKIYERSDVKTRYLEGLEPTSGFLSEPFETKLVIDENEFKMNVDVVNGQKTGYFLDQRENRAAISDYVKGAVVLDCFSHTGSFAVHAVGYGAQKVVAVDVSETAIEMAKANLELNYDDCDCDLIVGNVFDILREFERDSQKYDVVILDPPAFTKSRSSTESALRGYKDINLRGARILKEGGYLITASCSHHVEENEFVNVVTSAVADAGRTAKLIEIRSQSKDHPMALGVPESKYLKFLILKVD